MTRKRHSGITEAEATLARAFLSLEKDDAPLADPERAPHLLRIYHAAFVDLLVHGPLFCPEALVKERLEPSEWPMSDRDIVLLRAELLQLFRSTVPSVDGGPTSTAPISTYRALHFRVGPGVGRVGHVLVVRGSDIRDVVVLQALLLLQAVGLSNVHVCAAPDCARHFVKVYRREFCSKQCQKRINTRKQRAIAKQLQERRAQRRRDRRRKDV